MTCPACNNHADSSSIADVHERIGIQNHNVREHSGLYYAEVFQSEKRPAFEWQLQEPPSLTDLLRLKVTARRADSVQEQNKASRHPYRTGQDFNPGTMQHPHNFHTLFQYSLESFNPVHCLWIGRSGGSTGPLFEVRLRNEQKTILCGELLIQARNPEIKDECRYS
jgi:hypothetical protein